MWQFMALPCELALLILQYSLLVALVSSSGPGTGWKTLQGSLLCVAAETHAWKKEAEYLIIRSKVFHGNSHAPLVCYAGSPPLVIARGGFSGIFPDSSLPSYSLALNTSGPNVTLWCDVQLTKDGVGICFPELKLDNATDISIAYPGKAKDYSVNGVPTRGWFSVDYYLSQLANVSHVAKLVKSPSTGMWLNVQHDTFYKQQNLSVENFLQSLSTKRVSVNYISSPDADFLKRVRSNFSPRTTSLIFRFLEQYKIEPATKQTYGALLKNLTFIRTFASGILVPKGYIWPVDSDLYLQPHTSLVSDAHKQGLQVFVSELVNDVPFSYNFSYDPQAECLSFIDNGAFSVDGVLSDFPVTPSAAINSEISSPVADCFSGLGGNAKKQECCLPCRERNLSVTNAVLDALHKAGYHKPGSPKVMIQSTHSSVLKIFKDKSKYERIYKVDENIRDAVDSAIEDIKTFADSVVVNGIITDFPKTADRYRKNKCLKHGKKASYMSPVEPGKLLKQVTKSYLPPPAPPLPVLNDSNVTEAPLPGVSGKVPIPSAAPGIAAAPAPITA
ncbi:PLC-like phosphodiesterase, TIM beta/alpha-barrel domain superfamily [Sesbania bispinosa]|nr:PLC-like phosphodiesterase, TIM beta/alpha-barrel domain superfamily [Sesbania bispinosa]